jgi:hypothetical protein
MDSPGKHRAEEKMAWMDFFDSIRLLVTARITPDLFEYKEKPGVYACLESFSP